MRLFGALVHTVFLASALVSAAPTIDRSHTLPIRKGLSQGGKHLSAKEIVERDLARISAFGSRAHGLDKRAFGVVIINEDVSYVVPVTLCGTVYYLIADTGSANTWFGAGTKVPANCGTSTTHPFSVGYGSGTVSGTERTGQITIGNVTVTQSFGVATSTSGFSGVDGILGLGPVVLTEGTVSGVTSVPTILDQLYSQGSISVESIAFYFAPETGSDTSDANGELTFGGVDTAKYTGTLTYFPVSKTSPYSVYWGIATAGLTYGSTSLESSANAIVDTGTTLIYIPTSAYNKFLSVAGGTTDASSGLARFTTTPTSSFTIKIGTVSYPLTPAQYLVPKAQYSNFGLSTKYSYAWINNGGSVAASVNFIIGMKFLENYYSVFDVTHSQIGFATSV